MSNNWYIVSVSFTKVMDNGVEKKVSEKYLVDAMSPSEAELRFIKEYGSFFSGEFKIKSIAEEKINEMFFTEGLKDVRWFKAVVVFISLDEKTGSEKKTKSNMYIQSTDFSAALSDLHTGMKGTMSDWEVFSLAESAIVDVLKYK